MELIREIKNKSDQLGMISSTICMIHCLMTPLIFTIKACNLDGCCGSSPIWWKAVDVLFLSISLFAIISSYRNSSKSWVKGALVISWFILAFVIMNEYVHFIHLSKYVIYIPAISLVFLHFINRKYCACKEACCHS